ncbi:hypothetical protein D2E26_0181 [Bifidobacterium dolichotidis]|uniref:BspA family leucine-rich repeat surface protein n=1 Tax=Bifidobacterium dolichotidis TaxID=2306976 RepID=A0A430FRY0_9BIFI|nr:hypothetical protein [Bifidobacterium dolichotidis]RSX55618.1 hypothetical protein D2E26_0181 [Bifidobacterium dolichotidis]
MTSLARLTKRIAALTATSSLILAGVIGVSSANADELPAATGLGVHTMAVNRDANVNTSTDINVDADADANDVALAHQILDEALQQQKDPDSTEENHYIEGYWGETYWLLNNKNETMTIAPYADSTAPDFRFLEGKEGSLEWAIRITVEKVVIAHKLKATSESSFASMFEGCLHLEEVEGLGNISYENLKKGSNPRLYQMFERTKVQNVDFTGADFSTCSKFNPSYMFLKLNFYAKEPIELHLAGLPWEKVSSTWSMFNGAKISSVLIGYPDQVVEAPSIDTATAMFMNCPFLTHVQWNVTMPNLKDADFMFSKDGMLESIDLNNLKSSQLACITEMFGECYRLASLQMKGTKFTAGRASYTMYYAPINHFVINKSALAEIYKAARHGLPRDDDPQFQRYQWKDKDSGLEMSITDWAMYQPDQDYELELDLPKQEQC